MMIDSVTMMLDLRLPTLCTILHNVAFKFRDRVFDHVNSVAQYVHCLFSLAKLLSKFVCVSVCLFLVYLSLSVYMGFMPETKNAYVHYYYFVIVVVAVAAAAAVLLTCCYKIVHKVTRIIL